MRRSLAQRLAHKLDSALARVETAARFLVWIIGMFLALITGVAVLPILSPVNRYIVLISLILFLLSGLVVFVRDIVRQPSGEDSPNAHKNKMSVTATIEPNGAADTENRDVLIRQFRRAKMVQYLHSSEFDTVCSVSYSPL